MYAGVAGDGRARTGNTALGHLCAALQLQGRLRRLAVGDCRLEAEGLVLLALALGLPRGCSAQGHRVYTGSREHHVAVMVLTVAVHGHRVSTPWATRQRSRTQTSGLIQI